MNGPTTTTGDRAERLREALRSLVAERGLHDASVSAVASRAGVAAGTLYVHYGSKDDLVLAAYSEAKRELGQAAVSAVSPDLPPEERFTALWLAVHDHLKADPERARFLVQMDASPFAGKVADGPDQAEPGAIERFAATPDMAPLLLPLPLRVLYELAIGPAVRIAATGEIEQRDELLMVAHACWRAITGWSGQAIDEQGDPGGDGR